MKKYLPVIVAAVAAVCSVAWSYAPSIPDPVGDFGSFWTAMTAARRSGGLWPALVLGAYATLVAGRRVMPWLRQGRRAAWTAALVGVLGALVDVAVGVGAWPSVIAATFSGGLVLLEPQAKPKEPEPD